MELPYKSPARRKKSTVTPPQFAFISEVEETSATTRQTWVDGDFSEGLSGAGGSRRSEIPDAVIIFRAVDTQSLEVLHTLLDNRPEFANCHGGMFHMTPLHCAVENGWLEGVLMLVEKGASVTSRNQYGQTPLHYAAARGKYVILEELLKRGNVNLIDAQDLRGVTALHDAATMGSRRAVEVLLEYGSNCTVTDSNGQTALHKATKAGSVECAAVLMKAGADLLQKDDRGVTPKRYLREHPEYLETLLDMGIITSPNRQSGFPLTFDFSLLVAPYGIQQCRLLENFAKTDSNYLLAHPLVHILLLVKWRKTRLIFMGYLLFFTVFAALTYTLMFDRFIWSKCTLNNHTAYNQRANSRRTNNFTANDLKLPLKCETIDDVLGVKITMIFQMLIFTVGQVNRLRKNAMSCMKSLTWWLLLTIIILCTVIIVQSWASPQESMWWEHHVATFIIMLEGTQILHLLSKFPSYGIYWLMFIRVAEMFLRVFFIYLCLLLTFTTTFYLALHDLDKTTIFGNFGLTFLKSLTMMVGELDLSDMKDSLERLPVTSHIILILFILLISIILANLLVALAVSDINGLRSIAHLMRLASMVEAIFRLWPRTDQRHPKIVVKLSESAIRKPSLTRYTTDKSTSWFVCCLNKLRSNQYSVQISTCILENLLDRLDVKEGNGNSRLSVKFRCLGPSSGGRKISAAELVSRRRHTLCKSGPLQRNNLSRRIRAPSRKKKKFDVEPHPERF
ncbi:hypothetical protein HAZT_HAZT009235 [Hyalella azteca]|uniref:Ion transport domain-containing protein n=1 Tax=Hyalella azteca TaxID=294128 RepID=A0A6A0H9M3_HYAAZ|nr:hypothetical protein HAZT_HAZT009235 [Hyalella azteca]